MAAAQGTAAGCCVTVVLLVGTVHYVGLAGLCMQQEEEGVMVSLGCKGVHVGWCPIYFVFGRLNHSVLCI